MSHDHSDHEHHHHDDESAELPANYLDTGWLEVCLDVKNLGLSIEFYEKLGFVHVGGDLEEGWAVMENDACRFSLYQGHLEGNVLNFRGGNVQEIGEALKARGVALKTEVESEPDGSLGCTLVDPDGNLIYFNTHPDELEDCCCEDCDCEDGECDDDTCDCGHDHKHKDEESK